MASSDYPNYGDLEIKQINLDASSGIKMFDSSDDSKSVTLKVTGTIGAGNTDVALPVSGDLLTSNSDLPAANITGIHSLTPATIVDGDTFMFADASDSHNPKRALASALKTYVGADSVPSGTSGQVIVYNASNDAAAVAMSGHIAIDNAGATTLQNNVVTNAMVAAGANIAKSKLANLAIADADVAAGANIAKSKLANLAIADADVAAGANIAYAKLNLNNAVTNADLAGSIAQAKLADGFATAGTWANSKLCSLDANGDATGGRHLSLSGDVDVGASQAFYLGDKDTDGTWRMRVNGTAWVAERRESGNFVQKGSFTA